MMAWPYPFWFAHRGAGRLAPENTLAAFTLGAHHGQRAFECDVKLSADGVPFLLHDDTLERTTSGQGPAGQQPWAELTRLDAGRWHSPAFAGEPIPSLQVIADFCLAHGHALNIEIKPMPGDEERTGHAVACEATRHWAGQSRLPLLSSFRPQALAAARRGAPHLPRALLLETLRPGWLDEALALACIAVVSHHSVLTVQAITQLHDAGLRAMAYTVNDAQTARQLVHHGVDGLITDAIDRFCGQDFTLAD